MNPFALGLFNFVLLCLGAKQLTWVIGIAFPRVAGGTTRLIVELGFSQYIGALIGLACIACVMGAYARGTRWRAFAIALLLINNLALATFAFAVMGSITSATWNAATDFVLAGYLGLIMAVRAHDKHQYQGNTY